MGGPTDDQRHGDNHQYEPSPGGHPGLRSGVAETEYEINIHRDQRVWRLSSGRRQAEITEEHGGPGEAGPRKESAPVIAQPGYNV